jgi:protoporphyrinogen oxidase
MTSPRIVIIGGGPTGLGAAHRLTELKNENWTLLERSAKFGGLASTAIDDQGFLWDLGGHVLFSHYEYFDTLLDDLVGDDWFHHVREAWIWTHNRWIPYPFQNNLWRLPEEDRTKCIDGLTELQQNPSETTINTFDDWITCSLGEGIADVFMRPYNFKVWAFPPDQLSAEWVGDRVATSNLEKLRHNTKTQTDDVGWGPNSTFRFPASGGTGRIWSALASKLPQKNMKASTTVTSINPHEKTVCCQNGGKFSYDALISTIPMNELVTLLTDTPMFEGKSEAFRWSSTHVIGIGMKGTPPKDLKQKCWMYYPEPDVPFYRVTIFSNYAPANVPSPGEQWSLLCEISESEIKPVNHENILAETIQGLQQVGLINNPDEIISRWKTFLPYGYPTPFLGRDELIESIEPTLRSMRIYSRGRFGGWKYEVSNQDHSLMQGVEAIDNILFKEDEITYFSPKTVNGR